ncbi:MAG: sulfatase-like hydrolase/transferase [Bacteroidota bacterium]
MYRVQINLSLLLFALVTLVGCGALNNKSESHKEEKTSSKPNIILVMADDLGWGDTGYNGNKIIKTPNLDKMAEEGVQFNRFYSASAVCSPTRASVLTGRIPFRTGVFTANQGILRPEEITIPELVKEKGYVTGMFGKWHLGTLTTKEKDSNRGDVDNFEEYNPPMLHGFDRVFVTEAKVPTWDPMKKPVKGAKGVWDYIKDDEQYTHFGTHYWNQDGEKITNNIEGDDSRVIMDRVVPFINEAVNDDKPFLAVVWFHTPHKPCVAGPEYQKMYEGHDLNTRNFAGSITAMDEQIGRLRQVLKEKGVDENTIIWFCSDNGPESRMAGTTGGFRDRKRSLHEGGIRVPGLMVWPAKIKKAVKTDYPAVTTDYLPTIADVLNIDESKMKNRLDGTSLLPFLEGKTESRTDTIVMSLQNQVNCYSGQYKFYVRNKKPELYDIVNDPYETTLINDDKPDVLNRLYEQSKVSVESFKSSFEGDEYGQESFNKLKQKWADPFKVKNQKKKKKK